MSINSTDDLEVLFNFLFIYLLQYSTHLHNVYGLSICKTLRMEKLYGPLCSHFRWNSCKQNKQGANNCTANQNQTPSPEGEKLHSDSGISVDSQSLQEQQGQTQAQTGNTDAHNTCSIPVQTRLT